MVSQEEALWASTIGDLAIVENYIDGGGDIETKDFLGRTPLFLACYYNYLHLAKLLVSAGASIDVADAFGESPMHWAEVYGNPEMINLLKTLPNKSISNFTQGCNHSSVKDVWCGIGPSAEKIKVCCSCKKEV